MNMNYLLRANLNLFDGASGGAAAAGTGADAGAGSVAQGETNGTVPGNTRRGKSGAYDNVKFGKSDVEVTNAADNSQVAAGDAKTDAQPTSNTLDERRKAFQDLVNGEYKDIYTEETQRIINRRFKETNALQEQVNKNQPVIDMLMQRYDIKDGDVSKLTAAIENDDAYWSEAAEEAGMSLDQYKQFQKLQRENAALLKAQKAQREGQLAQAQARKWYQEAEAVKGKFPGFDLQTELSNPSFLSMLKSGTPVEHAYKVIHYDELMDNAMQVTAASTEKALVDNIRAKGARPAENGTAAQSAFIVKDDVRKFTKKDRAEIARRVARGEIIKL